ncbi:MAG: o-succinylbenzoate synthase, partial [Thermoleophilaceae bacterium]|nr:o-succinylbenzoate synthase [Thermoleophilaceae bacterium]
MRSVHVNVALASRAPDLTRTSGFDCVKLKVGFPDDAERVATVREALGPSVELRLDANAAWDVDTAVERVGALAHHGLAYVEQP